MCAVHLGGPPPAGFLLGPIVIVGGLLRGNPLGGNAHPYPACVEYKMHIGIAS